MVYKLNFRVIQALYTQIFWCMDHSFVLLHIPISEKTSLSSISISFDSSSENDLCIWFDCSYNNDDNSNSNIYCTNDHFSRRWIQYSTNSESTLWNFLTILLLLIVHLLVSTVLSHISNFFFIYTKFICYAIHGIRNRRQNENKKLSPHSSSTFNEQKSFLCS